MNRPLALPLAGILAVALASNLMAQTPPERSAESSKQEARDQQLPESGPVSPIDRTPVLPPVEGEPARVLSGVGSIRVERIVLEGGTVLTQKALSQIVAPYEGRAVTIEQLNQLRRELTEAYIQLGYINSGVVIPDQEVINGVVVLREICGQLTKIKIVGEGRFSHGFIHKKLEEAAKRPLRLQDLQEALELLQQEPMIQRVNARLVPGLFPGRAELEVSVKAVQPLQVIVGADNRRSASTGGEQGTLSVAHLNLTGRGDILSVDMGMAQGRGAGSAAYSFPLNSRNTRIQASFSIDDARIVEAPFDRIDIKSKTRRSSLSVMHPWLRDSRHSLVTSIGIEGKQSKSTLLGIPFSFSPGDQEGKSNTTVLNLGVEWRARTRDQILILGGNFRRGLRAFDATINQSGPDGRFSAFLGQVQYARRAGPWRGELLLREMVQWAFDPLLALEKMPVGGFNTVRGYRENRAVRDNGMASSVEWRVPVRGDRTEKGTFDPWNLRVAPFVDYGRSWDHHDQPFRSEPLDLASAGIGLLWSPLAGLRADLYWAQPITERDKPGNDLQDKGIHFSVQYKVPLW